MDTKVLEEFSFPVKCDRSVSFARRLVCRALSGRFSPRSGLDVGREGLDLKDDDEDVWLGANHHSTCD